MYVQDLNEPSTGQHAILVCADLLRITEMAMRAEQGHDRSVIAELIELANCLETPNPELFYEFQVMYLKQRNANLVSWLRNLVTMSAPIGDIHDFLRSKAAEATRQLNFG